MVGSGLRVAVLGLGEAGSEIARDLAAAGVLVRGYDPVVEPADHVLGCGDEADAVRGADLVLSVNSATAALTAARHAAPALAEGCVWADMNTSAAGLKVAVAQELAATGARFADVALMATVSGRGLRTPALVSGPGAQPYADALRPLGAVVEVLPGAPGEAATRKLLRSVFWKGTAAAVVEALTAARAAACEPWLRENIARELEGWTASSVDVFEEGSARHAVRRAHEMEAATELLGELGVTPRIAAASRDLLLELTGAAPRRPA